MGGTVSSGESNEELVDNLVSANYITKSTVERVFRTVDRGHYFPEDSEAADRLAYRDMAWRQGHVHISAPCIYSEVMENLELEAGLSFLNLGSGTGYLSTMAGLLLGVNGVNHGVEIYEDMVEYARQRLSQFMAKSGALDEFELCPPQFVCGNALMIPSGAQYDRVYCGAACCEGAQLDYLKNLVKVDGILITPVNSELIWYKRLSDDEWKSRILLPVSFASLLPTADPFLCAPILPQSDVHTLEDLCRFAVRAVFRQTIASEHPELLDCSERRAARKRIREKRKALSIDSDEEWGDISNILQRHRMKFDSGIVEDMDSDFDSLEWDECTSDSESDVAKTQEPEPKLEVTTPTFSDYMRDKIKTLILPKPLLRYLNLGRAL